jgi:hypothetical protein
MIILPLHDNNSGPRSVSGFFFLRKSNNWANLPVSVRSGVTLLCDMQRLALFLFCIIITGGTMPKARNFSPKRVAEVLHKLDVIEINLESVWTELVTGNREPFSIPAKERVFNARLHAEQIQAMFGRRVI